MYSPCDNFLFPVNDFEDQLQQKNSDMEQQLQLVSDLDVEIKRQQVISFAKIRLYASPTFTYKR